VVRKSCAWAVTLKCEGFARLRLSLLATLPCPYRYKSGLSRTTIQTGEYSRWKMVVGGMVSIVVGSPLCMCITPKVGRINHGPLSITVQSRPLTGNFLSSSISQTGHKRAQRNSKASAHLIHSIWLILAGKADGRDVAKR
jgi:hypothetical protein